MTNASLSEADVIIHFSSTFSEPISNQTTVSIDSPTSDDHVLLEMIIKAFFMGLLIVMALFGNALVIVSVIRIRKLRTITNYFVISLAVADFLVGALVMPFNASQEILKRWVFPEWVCTFFNSNDVLFCTASVLNLCMVAVDRYVSIMNPLRYRQVMTKRAAALMITFVWTASLAISYVPIHLNWHLPNFEAIPNPGHCDFKPSAIYSLTSSAISFWLPTLVILFVYGRIYHIAVSRAREMRKLEKHMANVSTAHSLKALKSAASITKAVSKTPSSQLTVPATSDRPQHLPLSINDTMNSSVNSNLPHSSGSFGSGSNMNQQNRNKGTSRSSESRATKVLAIVIGCYLMCWMPFFTWLNVMAICTQCPDSGVLGTILFWIGYSNSTLNPVIYAFFSREFRNAFIASLRIDKWAISRCCLLGKDPGKAKLSGNSYGRFAKDRSNSFILRRNYLRQRQTEVNQLPIAKEEVEDEIEGDPQLSTLNSPTQNQMSVCANEIASPDRGDKTKKGKKKDQSQVSNRHRNKLRRQSCLPFTENADISLIETNMIRARSMDDLMDDDAQIYSNQPTHNGFETSRPSEYSESKAKYASPEAPSPFLQLRSNLVASDDIDDDELSLKLLSIRENMES